jgi:vacuolar-type H+-ATPase subunit F/Vma7
MTLCALIADEVTAAGFRLAGLEVQVPEDAEVPACFRALLARSEILMITAERAARLPPRELEQALAQPRPLLVIIPDVRHRREPPDLGARLRRQLGMAE